MCHLRRAPESLHSPNPLFCYFYVFFLVRSYDNFYVCEFYKLATFSGVYLLQMYITEGGMLLVFKRCKGCNIR